MVNVSKKVNVNCKSVTVSCNNVEYKSSNMNIIPRILGKIERYLMCHIKST